ncbi:MAG: hypothetical protein RIQ71_1929, partial [Verrucomicrobiota bacterium]
MRGIPTILFSAALLLASRPVLCGAESTKLPTKPNILFA